MLSTAHGPTGRERYFSVANGTDKSEDHMKEAEGGVPIGASPGWYLRRIMEIFTQRGADDYNQEGHVGCAVWPVHVQG